LFSEIDRNYGHLFLGWNFLQLENFFHGVSPVEDLLRFETFRKVRDLDLKTTIPVSVTGRRVVTVSVVIVILVLVVIRVMWGYSEMGY
jgi:hypothetical protein